MNHRTRRALVAALLVPSFFLLASAFAAASSAPKDLGQENVNKIMNVNVFMNLRNADQFHTLAAQIQDKNSPNYHKFLTPAQFAAQFAPAASDLQKVENFLAANGLTVTRAVAGEYVVSATGTVGHIETAFHTAIHKYQFGTQVVDQSISTPAVPSTLKPLVQQVAGLQTLKMSSHLSRVIDPATMQPIKPVKFTKSKPDGAFFPGNCFSVNNSVYYLYGKGLEAIYSGNGYPSSGCGYAPAEIQHAYGFDHIYPAGYDGAGQTIVIVDAYGSNTITNDANVFSSEYGLPALVPGTNFSIINNPTGGTPDCTESPTTPCGWEEETTLDVEWAHAIAPGAKIVLVVSPTANFSDLAAIDAWIPGNIPTGTVSHSFGSPEDLVATYDPTDFANQYSVNYVDAQILGVSNNYSSGDDGDFYNWYVSNQLTPIHDVSFPAGSPDATSVGGTSLALDSSGNYLWEEGWGTNATNLGYVPPYHYGFLYGSGGGASLVTAAPSWQSSFIAGETYRQQPDVAMDGDPYTGVEIIYTDYWDTPSSPAMYVTVIGGTSLSCPMFSAFWSIIEQAAGTPYLGNAAPLLYELANSIPGAFNDIKPIGSGHNAHGTIFNNGVPTAYSQWDLAQPYQNAQTFYETLWHPGNTYSITFGTDSSLTTGTGWDNVTGVGTPNLANLFAATD